MSTQFSALGYRIDLYFHDYTLAIDVDGNNQKDRDTDYEIERQKQQKRRLAVKLLELIMMGMALTRLNP